MYCKIRFKEIINKEVIIRNKERADLMMWKFEDLEMWRCGDLYDSS